MAILRVRTVLSGFAGSPGMMTQYFQGPGPHDTNVAQLCVDRVRDSLTAAVSLFPSTMVWAVQGQVDELAEASGTLTNSFNVTQRTVIGTAIGGFGPIAAGICVVWVTSEFANGRRVIGKTFLVPVTPNVGFTDGTLTSTAIATATSFADSMDNAGATQIEFGVWHRPVNGVGGSFHNCVGNRVPDKFAVLRSRRD